MDEKKKRPTLKVYNALLDYVQHPTDKMCDIASRNGIKYDTLRLAIHKHQDIIQEESMKIWKEKKTMAMRCMEQLAERGNFRALDFLLRSQGIVPEERVTTDNQEIVVTINDNDKN